MDFQIDGIFMPSVGVDLVFDMNSLNPVARSSIIHDGDLGKKTIIIAQPLIPITPPTSFDLLHLTTIFRSKQRKIRVGIQCQIIEFDNRYSLANQTVSKAVILKYKLPVEETNIRSAFRFPLSRNHTIKAKIIYRRNEYYTTRDFSIRDISLTGMGLAIPKRKEALPGSLTGLKKADIISLGMILLETGGKEEKPLGIFSLKAEVIRMNKNYSDSHVLVGLKTINLSDKNETLLNRFIHNAQIDELKRLRFRKD